MSGSNLFRVVIEWRWKRGTMQVIRPTGIVHSIQATRNVRILCCLERRHTGAIEVDIMGIIVSGRESRATTRSGRLASEERCIRRLSGELSRLTVAHDRLTVRRLDNFTWPE